MGSRVLGGLLCHHSEMEPAQKSKQDLSPSLPQAQTNLVWVMGFSVVLFVCLFGLEPMDTQHGAERRSGGMEDIEERRGGDEGAGGEDV